MLGDPEVATALKKSSDIKLEKLLKGIDITENDTIETLSKKHQDQLKEVVNYFNDKLGEVEASAIEKAQKPAVDKENQRIQEFSKKNEGMSNAEVVRTMQPLYDSGKSLEDAYAMACRALEVNPETGVTVAEEAKKNKEDKGEEKKEVPKSSKKSEIGEDSSPRKEADTSKDTEGKSLQEIISENMNAEEAKNGSPFTN